MRAAYRAAGLSSIEPVESFGTALIYG
jgi:hypothetical protein